MNNNILLNPPFYPRNTHDPIRFQSNGPGVSRFGILPYIYYLPVEIDTGKVWRIPKPDIRKTLSKVTCLQADEEGHESYEKLGLLCDQVLLGHRNRREIIDQDQEGSNANLPKETRFWDERRRLRSM